MHRRTDGGASSGLLCFYSSSSRPPFSLSLSLSLFLPPLSSFLFILPTLSLWKEGRMIPVGAGHARSVCAALFMDHRRATFSRPSDGIWLLASKAAGIAGSENATDGRRAKEGGERALPSSSFFRSPVRKTGECGAAERSVGRSDGRTDTDGLRRR